MPLDGLESDHLVEFGEEFLERSSSPAVRGHIVCLEKGESVSGERREVGLRESRRLPQDRLLDEVANRAGVSE